MKKHLILLILSSFLTFSLSQESEEEIQIYTIDDIDYSVNPYSQNLTALNGATSNTENLNNGSIGKYNLNFSIGNASPIGENLRNRYANGCSLQSRQIMGFWRKLCNPMTYGKDENGNRKKRKRTEKKRKEQ